MNSPWAVESSMHVLAVHSLADSWTFYADVLGMEPVHREGDQIGILRLGGFALFLGQCPDAIDPHQLGDHRPFARVRVRGLADYHHKVADQYDNLTAVEAKPWGMSEFALETPDGHRLTFYEPNE